MTGFVDNSMSADVGFIQSVADATHNKALEAGASTVMGLLDQSYGRTSGVRDPAGNTWWITSAS